VRGVVALSGRSWVDSPQDGRTWMADVIRLVDYFYITLGDRPGEGSRALNMLREAGVHLNALHAFPTGRRSTRLCPFRSDGVQDGDHDGEVEDHRAEEGICHRG
jgi:hypothetical protein